MNRKINTNILIVLALVLVTVVIRYINVAVLNDTPFAQFTPLFAMCLFAGSYIKNIVHAIVLTLIAMFASDLLIQNLFYKGQYGVLYSGWYIQYPLYLGFTMVGHYLISKVNIVTVLAGAVGSAVAYFVISNFIVWLGGIGDARTNFTVQLPKTWAGLQQCYIQAIPFFKNNVIATVLYSGVLYGVYELVKQKANSLATVTSK